MISIGNKADVSENDILKYWNEDERIKTSTFYLESFSDGGTFLQSFIQGKGNSKPVIILKVAELQAGIKAACSHTGQWLRMIRSLRLF